VKKVLVLGAGLVSRPLVRYLLDHGFAITVASRTVSKAEKLLDRHPNGTALPFQVGDDAALRRLVSEHDVAVSLLPAAHHVDVARACIEFGKHMATTSYVSPEMKALDAAARGKGLLLLNEMGVDPGIDHMSAMEVIHRERERGGTLVGFSSWCGGLPAPEANDNPFGYKCSWTPKGVLLAARNSARYLRGGKIVEIPAERLFSDPARVEIPGVGTFEGYPNRDSVAYVATYGFGPEVKEMFRGTLRNLGHCALYTQLIRLGFLENETPRTFAGMTYAALFDEIFGGPAREKIAAKLGASEAAAPLAAVDHLGLLANTPIEIAKGTILDLFADRMAKVLAYRPGERDMIVMRHDLTFAFDGGKRRERITAILVDYGIPHGESSMSRTVSLPAAIGVRMLLEGKIDERGVKIPLSPGIYAPVLRELEGLGIRFRETRAAL